jgi:hypothetical protein
LCDDGVYCNGAETCSAVSDCQAGTAVECGDGVGCTVDSCNEGTDSRDHVATDSLCDDGVYCNGAETCSAVNDCQAGTAVECGDGVGCTVDSCNEDTDSCDHVATDSLCDDGVYCNGAEICSAVSDCQAGMAPCPDDGLFCNGTESCDELNDQCTASGDPCLDGNDCTDDLCDEDQDVCQNRCGAVGPGDACCADPVCAGSPVCAGEFLITSITQDWGGTNDVNLAWESVSGQVFDISLKDGLTGTFHVVDTVVASGNESTWTDDGLWAGGTHPSTVQERYYRVTRYGQDSGNTVGMFRITVGEGMNLVGLPLVPAETSLEAVLNGQLTGADNEGDADRVWVWNGSNFEFAWLAEGAGVPPQYQGAWFTGVSPASMTLEADQGFWVQVRPGHGSTELSFLGEVPGSNRTIVLQEGMNLVSPSSPQGRPVGDQGVSDANLWESGVTGADNEGDADRIWSWSGTNYQFHWLVDDVSPAYNGSWYAGNNPSSLSIEPGRGYWVQIRQGHGTVHWTYPVGP